MLKMRGGGSLQGDVDSELAVVTATAVMLTHRGGADCDAGCCRTSTPTPAGACRVVVHLVHHLCHFCSRRPVVAAVAMDG